MMGMFLGLVALLRRFPEIPNRYVLGAHVVWGLALLSVLFYVGGQFAWFPGNRILQHITVALFSIVLTLFWAWLTFLMVIVILRPSASL